MGPPTASGVLLPCSFAASAAAGDPSRLVSPYTPPLPSTSPAILGSTSFPSSPTSFVVSGWPSGWSAPFTPSQLVSHVPRGLRVHHRDEVGRQHALHRSFPDLHAFLDQRVHHGYGAIRHCRLSLHLVLRMQQ